MFWSNPVFCTAVLGVCKRKKMKRKKGFTSRNTNFAWESWSKRRTEHCQILVTEAARPDQTYTTSVVSLKSGKHKTPAKACTWTIRATISWWIQHSSSKSCFSFSRRLPEMGMFASLHRVCSCHCFSGLPTTISNPKFNHPTTQVGNDSSWIHQTSHLDALLRRPGALSQSHHVLNSSNKTVVLSGGQCTERR